jgi:hypothetical protein
VPASAGGGVVPASLPEPPPQAHRLSSISAVSSRARNFFFILKSTFLFDLQVKHLEVEYHFGRLKSIADS